MCQLETLTQEAEIKFWREVAKKGFPLVVDMYSKKEINKKQLMNVFDFAVGKTDKINKKILNSILDDI